MIRMTIDDEENKKLEEPEEENVFAEDFLTMATLSGKEKRQYKKDILKKRLDTMDKKEQRKYIVYYYKWHFIGALLVIAFVSWVSYIVFNAVIPTPLNLTVVNFGECEQLTKHLPADYREYFNIGKNNHIDIYVSLEVDKDKPTDVVETNVTDFQLISMYCTQGMTDALILDEDALTLLKNNCVVTDAEQVLSTDLFDKIKKDVIFTTDETYEINNGNPYALAIEITDTGFCKKYGLNKSHVYLAVPVSKAGSYDEKFENFVKLIYGY